MSLSPSAGTAAPAGFDFEQLTPAAPRQPAPSLESASAQARAMLAKDQAQATSTKRDAERYASLVAKEEVVFQWQDGKLVAF